jgi:hypothetical protein
MMGGDNCSVTFLGGGLPPDIVKGLPSFAGWTRTPSHHLARSYNETSVIVYPAALGFNFTLARKGFPALRPTGLYFKDEAAAVEAVEPYLRERAMMP